MKKLNRKPLASNSNRRKSLHLRFGNLEKLEDRRLLAADLGLHQKPVIDLDLNASAPFHYVADGRAIGLSPVSGELLVGTKRELGFSVSELFSANPVALGIAVDHEVHLGVSREVQLDRSWVREIQPLSDRLVSLKIDASADWNARLAELYSSFSTESAPSAEDFWTAPVLRNAESGLRQWVTDEVIVRLEPGVEPEQFFSDAMFSRYRNLLGTNDQFVATVANSTGIETLGIVNDVLPQRAGVVWATMNFAEEAMPQLAPNDPQFLSQWHLFNFGQSGAQIDADVDAELAWDTVVGNPGVVIAIMDDGVQTDHPDLDMWVNPNESLDVIDNDGNGWIDDINGLNFVDASNTTDNPNLNNPSPMLANDNHGTAVAGSASTRGNNGVGIAGVAFGTKIMGIRTFACPGPGPGCTTSSAAIAQSVYYAAGRTANGLGTWRGADVLNVSYSLNPSTADTTAFDWAAANGRNGLGTPVFASTGNEASGAKVGTVNISLPASLNPGAEVEFRYRKDGSVSEGDDRVWINWARYPNGTVERFDRVSGPIGWTTGGDVIWGTLTNPETARADGTGRFPMRSFDLSDNQTSTLRTPEIDDSGSFRFSYWMSTEADFDKLEVFVRYRDFFGVYLPFQQTNFSIPNGNGGTVTVSSDSGIFPFTPNAIYPANLASTIGVGASTDWDYKAGYSQYGPGLDFVAPSGGGNLDLLTTDRTGAAGYDNGSDYVRVAGTSFSSPLAAGVGALMLSRNPELTAAQLRTIMQNTAEEIGGVTYPGGVNEFFGHGRINANGAVLAAGVDGNDRIATATPISLNSTTSGRLGTTTDVDLYAVSLNGGTRLSIDLDHFTTDGTTDTFLRLFDSTGAQLASNDDSVGPAPEVSSLESYLEFTVPSNGTYYIGVSAFGNGNYNPNNGTGKTDATIARLGNYQVRVNDISSSMLLVNLTNDAGDGRFFNGVTLREAITYANQLFTTPTIQFDTAGVFSTPQTINLSGGQGSLPIQRSMTINGANRVTVNAQSSSRVFDINDATGALRNVTLSGMTIRGGSSPIGGGILNRENLTLTEVVVTANTTSSDGGGIWNAGQLQVTRSAIHGNTANRGGGIFQQEGTSTITETTLALNNANTGGGIANFTGTANIQRSTIAQNQTGIWSQGNIVLTFTNVQGSIVSNNTSGDVIRDGAFFITIASQGHNIVGNGTAIGNFSQPTDQVGVDPLLESFTNHGGPTPVFNLLPGSPAINRGNPAIVSPPATDQRGTGFPRIRGGVIDVGAFEAQPPVVNVIGNLAQPSTTQRNYNLRASEVVFYQFTLPSPIQAASNQFLVIDTLGSGLPPNNDTEIGLYDASGNRIADNDDYSFFSNNESRLGFGDIADSSGDLAAGTYYLSLSAFSSQFGNSDFNVTSSSSLTGNAQVNIQVGTAVVPATIVGSFVNHTGYTGGGSSIDSGKSLAKETGSPTLLTYNNLINSSRGINSLLFDVQDLAGTVTTSDFVFQMSPTGAFNEGANPVAGWVPAPAPTSFFTSSAPGSPTRIGMDWPNNAIANRWLRVTVLANANTGLAADEVYYVGHLLGETTGPIGTVFTVAFADITPIRGAVGGTVNANSIHDIDKNGTVSFADISAMRSNVGAQLSVITIPASDFSAPLLGGLLDGGSKKNRSLGTPDLRQLLVPSVNNQWTIEDEAKKRRQSDIDDFFANYL